MEKTVKNGETTILQASEKHNNVNISVKTSTWPPSVPNIKIKTTDKNQR